MRPDLLGGPGPGEEDSGLLHEGSRKRMGNEEMRRGGYSETDLNRDREEEKKTTDYIKFLCTYVCMRIYTCMLQTTVNRYDWPVVLGEGAESW